MSSDFKGHFRSPHPNFSSPIVKRLIPQSISILVLELLKNHMKFVFGS